MNDILKETIKLVPEQPGCYLYYDKEGEIIYVGKAKNLKRRVTSYFQKKHDSVKLKVMVPKKLTDQEKEIYTKLKVDSESIMISEWPKYNEATNYDKEENEIEKLKLKLWKEYEHNRDAYTNAKTEFVNKYTEEARKLYGNRY